MNKLLPLCGAAALALALSLAAISPSSADPAGDAVGAGLAGGILGFMAGAAVAGSPSYDAPRYHHYGDYGPSRGSDNWRDQSDYRWRQHVRACFRAYGSDYDPRSDTFVGYDGHPHRCRY